MSPEYRLRVAGLIGPVVASCLPDLTVTALPTSTVLCGTATDTADILAVFDVLAAHGLPPIDTLITPLSRGHQQGSVRDVDQQHSRESAP